MCGCSGGKGLWLALPSVLFVRVVGFEPTNLAVKDFKSSAFACFAIPACGACVFILFMYYCCMMKPQKKKVVKKAVAKPSRYTTMPVKKKAAKKGNKGGKMGKMGY